MGKGFSTPPSTKNRPSSVTTDLKTPGIAIEARIALYTLPERNTTSSWLVISVATAVYFIFMFSRSEEHTSELQSRENLVCRLLLEKKKKQTATTTKRAK